MDFHSTNTVRETQRKTESNTESNTEKKRQRKREKERETYTNLKIIILVDICSSVLSLDKSKRKQMTKKRKSYNTKYRIIDIQYK